ncbi:MAG: discoidin domain-containing protein, partial [Pseudomonadota bacterium]
AQADPAPDALAAAPALATAAPVYGPPPLLARLPEKRAGLIDLQLPPEFTPPARRLDLNLGPATALVLPAEAWPASLGILEGRLATPPVIERRGGQVIVTSLAPRPPEAWAPPPAGTRVQASRRLEDAAKILDGRADTRWHPGAPQGPGQWLELDLGQALLLAGLRCEVGDWPTDWPRRLRVEVDPGDGLWRQPDGLRVTGGAPAWGGGRVLRRGGVQGVRFAPQMVRRIRLTQTGSHPTYHWSVARIMLLPARPGQMD